MSVQHDSLEVKQADRKPDAPELAYKAANQDSLSMFFAAIGGAVIGMLATLLVLALVNGGTLNFTHPERLAVMEANLARVNENVGSVSQNVDTVALQVTGIRDGLARAAAEVDQANAQLTEQGTSMADVQSAMESLQVTGQKFDTFVLALDQALASMNRLDGAPPAAVASAASEATGPTVTTDAAVPAGDVAVMFFQDTNGDGVMDTDETILVGPQVAVHNEAGETVGTYVSTDAGVLVEDLAPGSYTFVVEDAVDYRMAGAQEIDVTVPETSQEGQIVYFPTAQ